MEDENHTVSSGDLLEPLPKAYMLSFFWIISAEAILAVIGNSFTIAAILKFDRLQTVQNMLIGLLAGADLSAGISVVFSVLTYIVGVENWSKWVSFCRVKLIFSEMASLGNSLFSLVIAVDRYIFIVHPLRYHSIMAWERVVKLVVVMTSSIIGLTTLLFILSMFHETDKSKVNYCFDAALFPVFVKVLVFVVIVLPTFITAGLYSKVARVVRRQQLQVLMEQQRYGAVYPMGRQRKMTITLGLCVTVYILTTIPLYISGALQNLYSGGRVVTRSLAMIYRLNTFLNPIILAWRHKEFRKAFKKLIKRSSGEVDNSVL